MYLTFCVCYNSQNGVTNDLDINVFFYLGEDHARQDEETCEDTMTIEKCVKRKNNGNCDKPNVIKKCMKTCGLCGKYFDLQNDTFGN